MIMKADPNDNESLIITDRKWNALIAKVNESTLFVSGTHPTQIDKRLLVAVRQQGRKWRR